MSYFKDDPDLQHTQLNPDKIYDPLPPQNTVKGKLARTYNRIGGLLEAFGSKTDTNAKAVLAVWYVESGGSDFEEGRPILRFENHKFWKYWGKSHANEFDRHFQMGGRNGIPGKPWKRHKYRKSATGSWKKFHGNQTKEYDVFDFGASLANREAAALACSFGGPQVMGFNHDRLGYETATELYQRFSDSERWHVCGFFDFCKSMSLIDEIRDQRWLKFATLYNGSGQAPVYEDRLEKAFQAAQQLGDPTGVSASPAAADGAVLGANASYMSEFRKFIESLGLRYFKPYEFLVKGSKHNNPNSPAYGLNTDPPKSKWGNIADAARVIDELRSRLEVPITLTSVYRSPDYNSAIGGAGSSRHVEFDAIDFVVANHMPPSTWADILRDMRTAGVFKGGIGVYPGFVHVDTRGSNADWSG